MAFAAIGGVRSAYAQPEIIHICGPEIISEGDTRIYAAVTLNDEPDVQDTFAVDLNDFDGGDSEITSAVIDEEEYVELGTPTDFIDDLDDIDFGDPAFDDVIDDVEAADSSFSIDDCITAAFADIFEDLAGDILDQIEECLDQAVCENDDWVSDPGVGDVAVQETDLTLSEIAEAWAEIIIDDPQGILGDSCFNAFHDEAELFLIQNGVSEDEAADAVNQFCNFISDDFDFDGLGLEDVGFVIVDVTCEDAGTFDLSFAADMVGSGSAGNIEVTCVGEVDEGLITATPTKVEIVPAQGSVSYSLIVVELLDENGDPVQESAGVDFSTDRCEFLDEDGIGDLETLKAALDVFADYDPNHPDSAVDVHDFVDANIEDDPDDVSNEVPSFTLDDDAGDFDEDDTLAAIVLDCSDEDTVPGIAEVCFQVDQEGGDVMGCVKVTVVGPPAKVTAAAAPTTLICGEKATITVTVKDSADQNVSDHTRVEAVTNLGGVLAGTGAVAGQAGLVVPISSTVAETFNGVATFYLLTSDAHAGPYEVVIATGGSGSVNTGLGGVFSTPPQVTQVTVTCSQPVVAAPAAPTVTAPSTGTGSVSPPNTGDGGLVADQTSAGFSWALVAVAGVLAFSVAGLATLKISRR
jgi:hypothetical protein